MTISLQFLILQEGLRGHEVLGGSGGYGRDIGDCDDIGEGDFWEGRGAVPGN